MNTIQMSYFVTVAECLNFTKAAQITFTSQPNISKQIALLEQELGFDLFYRTKHSVVLTKAGITLYEELKRLLTELNAAIEKAAKESKNTQYNINIGVSTYLNTKKLGYIIKNFQEKYPLSNVSIESVDFKTLRSKLVNGNYDIAISLEFVFDGMQDINEVILSEHSMLLVCAKSHPLANKPDATVGDFKNDLFFVLEPTETPKGTELVFEICKKYGFIPKTENCNSLASYFINLELGYGVAIVDNSLRFPDKSYESLAFIKIPEDLFKNHVVAAWHNKNNNPAKHLFINEIEIFSEIHP